MQLQPGKDPPRPRMDEGPLHDSAESIKAQGVMQAILVRLVGPDHFEIIEQQRQRLAQTRLIKRFAGCLGPEKSGRSRSPQPRAPGRLNGDGSGGSGRL